jgi:hypothetical protein
VGEVPAGPIGDLVRGPRYVPTISTKPRPSPTGDAAGGTAPTSRCRSPPRTPADAHRRAPPTDQRGTWGGRSIRARQGLLSSAGPPSGGSPPWLVTCPPESPCCRHHPGMTPSFASVGTSTCTVSG